MSDGLFFFLAGVTAAALIALALVWPQGLGTRSPGRFGHPVAVDGPPAPGPAPAPPPPANATAAQLKGAL